MSFVAKLRHCNTNMADCTQDVRAYNIIMLTINLRIVGKKRTNKGIVFLNTRVKVQSLFE